MAGEGLNCSMRIPRESLEVGTLVSEVGFGSNMLRLIRVFLDLR